jgi:hypothetical protein
MYAAGPSIPGARSNTCMKYLDLDQRRQRMLRSRSAEEKMDFCLNKEVDEI